MARAVRPKYPDRTTLHILNDNEVPGTMPESESTRITGKAPDIIIRHQREIEEAAPFGVKGVQGCSRCIARSLRSYGNSPAKSRRNNHRFSAGGFDRRCCYLARKVTLRRRLSARRARECGDAN